MGRLFVHGFHCKLLSILSLTGVACTLTKPSIEAKSDRSQATPVAEEETSSTQPPASTTTTEDAAVSARITDASAAQTMTAPGGTAIKGAAVTFPPGSLAIGTEVMMAQGSDIVTDATAATLGLEQSIGKATEAVVVQVGIETAPAQPFQVALPLPDDGAALTDSFDLLVVIYKVKVPGSDGYRLGMLLRNSLDIDGHLIRFQSDFFGVFQAAWLQIRIDEAKDAQVHAPILTKSAEKALPSISFEPELSLDAPGRSATLRMAVSGLGALERCAAVVDADKQAPFDRLIDGGANPKFTITAQHPAAHAVYARVSCRDIGGRDSGPSPWQVIRFRAASIASGTATATVVVTTTTEADTSTATATSTSVGDTTPPANVAITIAGGSAYTNTAEVSLALIGDDATEMLVTNLAGCASGGTWEPVASTKSWTLSPLNGSATVYAKFRDAALNESACVSDAIVHDDSAPNNPSISIASGATATASAAVTLSLAATGASEMYITDSAGCSSGGSWQPYTASASWSLPSANAANTVHVKFRDAAHNETGCVSDAIVHDDQAPTSPAITIEAGAAAIGTSAVTIQLSATGASEMYVTSTAGCGSGGTWEPYASSRSWTLGQLGAAAAVYAKFRDAAANVTSCVSDSIVHDSTAPSVASSISGTYGPSTTAGATTALGGTAADSGSGLAKVQLSVQDGTTSQYLAAGGGAFSSATEVWHDATGTTSWSFAVTDSILVSGRTYQVRLKSMDNASNSSAVATPSFAWDSTVPTLGFSTPAAGTVINGSAASAFSIAGSCSDNSLSVAASVATSAVGSTTCGSGTWTIAANLTGVADGSITIDLSSSDAVGNQGTASRSFVLDKTAPTPGSSGAIATGSVTPSSIGLSWSAGSDARSTQPSLSYEVYRSFANNIDTPANAVANGVKIAGPSSALTSLTASGLSPSTAYYFNIVVADEAGNTAAYATQAATTSPDNAPTVGTPTITVSMIGSQGLSLSWTAAADDVTATGNLQYKVCRSTSNNLTSIALANANCTDSSTGFQANLTSQSIDGLAAGTTYYLNVIVKDGAGNVAVYTSASATTAKLHVALTRNLSSFGSQLLHSAYGGGAWTSSAVLDTSTSTMPLDLTVDSNGRPQIAYANGNTLKFVSYSTSWGAPVTTGGSVGAGITLGMDSSNVAKIGYLDSGNNVIKYIDNSGGTWNAAQTVYSGGQKLGAAINPSGRLVICSSDSSMMAIGCRDKPSGSWNAATVQPSGSGNYSDVDIAISGADHFVAYSGLSDGKLYFGKSTDGGATFIRETVVTTSATSSLMPKITLETGGTVHIVFYDAAAAALKHAYGSFGSWTIETIVSGIGTLSNHSFGADVDARGVTHVAYANQSTKMVMHTARVLGGWSTPDVIFDGSADTGSMYAGLLTRLEVGN